jgi:hypothetical protein
MMRLALMVISSIAGVSLFSLIFCRTDKRGIIDKVNKVAKS